MAKLTALALMVLRRGNLDTVAGVRTAQASNETHTATVTYDPARASPEDLIRATTEAGYPSTLKQ